MIRRLSWRGDEKKIIPITDLKGAEVQQRRNQNQRRRNKSQRISYLLTLYTNDQSFIVSYNGTSQRKEKMADRVNSFLNNPDDNSLFEQIEEIHTAKWIIAGIFATVGYVTLSNKVNNRKR